MKKITCPRCGSEDAFDFVFKVLCPNESCIFYDPKLSDENNDDIDPDFIVDDNGNSYLYSDFNLEYDD